MASLSIHYHQRQIINHQRRSMIAQRLGAVLAAATKIKRGKLFLAARATNRIRRSPLSNFSSFGTTKLSTLRRKIIEDLNRLIVTMDVCVVVNVTSITNRSFTRWYFASEGPPATGCTNLTINCQNMFTLSEKSSAICWNLWQQK